MPTTTQPTATPELDREAATERDERTADALGRPSGAYAGLPARPDRVGQLGQLGQAGQFGHDNTFLRHTKPASRRPR